MASMLLLERRRLSRCVTWFCPHHNRYVRCDAGCVRSVMFHMVQQTDAGECLGGRHA